MNSEQQMFQIIIWVAVVLGIGIFLYFIISLLRPKKIITEGQIPLEQYPDNLGPKSASPPPAKGALSIIEEVIRLTYDNENELDNIIRLNADKRRYLALEDFELYVFVETFQDLRQFSSIESNLESLENTLTKLSQRDIAIQPYAQFYNALVHLKNKNSGEEFIEFGKLKFKTSSNQNKLRKTLMELHWRFQELAKLEKLTVMPEGQKKYDSIKIAKSQFQEIRKAVKKLKSENLFKLEKLILNEYLEKTESAFENYLLNSQFNVIPETTQPKTDKFELALERESFIMDYSKKIVLPLTFINTNSKYSITNAFFRLEGINGFKIEGVKQGKNRLKNINPGQSLQVNLVFKPNRMEKSYQLSIEFGYHNNNSEEKQIEITLDYSNSRPTNRPYSPTQPKEKIDYFYGRRMIINEIIELINNTRKGDLILVFGLTRMGKSSLIYEIMNNEVFEEDFVKIFFSLDVFYNWDENWYRQLVVQIAQEIIQQLEIAEIHIPQNLYSTIEEIKHWSPNRKDSFDEKLIVSILENKSIQSELEKKNKYVIIIIDEYQRIEYEVTPKLRSQKRDFFQLLKQIGTDNNRVSIILSGYNSIASLMKRERYETNKVWTETLGKGFRQYKVSFLEEEPAKQLISEPMAEFEISYEKEVLEEIYFLTQGYPWYIHAICDKLFDKVKNKEGEKIITKSHLDPVIKEILSASGELHQQILNFLENIEKDILEAILQIIALAPDESIEVIDRFRYVSRTYIINEFGAFGFTYQPTRILNLLGLLEENELLFVKRKKNEDVICAIKIPFFELLIQQVGRDLETTIERMIDIREINKK